MHGPNDDIEITSDSKKLDWEVELGIVIGKDLMRPIIAKYIKTLNFNISKPDKNVGLDIRPLLVQQALLVTIEARNQERGAH